MKRFFAFLLLVCTLTLTACDNFIPNIPDGTEPPADTTDAPATDAPTATDAPEVTESYVTDSPETTNVPDITDMPETLPVPDTTEAPKIEILPPEDENFVPVMRFVAATDTHIINESQSNYSRLTSMINQLTAYAKSGADGYDKLDAIAVSGDISNSGTIDEFMTAKKAFDENMDEGTELVITTGNHDWYKFNEFSVMEFEKIFGYGCTMRDVVIGGYHFITLVGSLDQGLTWSEEDVKKAQLLIESAIADTGKDKPVFVFQHIGNIDTVFGTCSAVHQKTYTATKSLIDMESNYENLVIFSGHSHYPPSDECSIYQGDFTAIHAGCMYYAMPSMVDMEWIIMPDRYNMCQCLLIELDADSRMRVRCWDVLQEKFVGETFIIPSWKKEDFIYNERRFSEDDLFFAADNEIKMDFGLVGEVDISFLPVPEESLSGRVYEVTVTNTEGVIVSKEYVGVEYFNEKFDEPIKHTLSGLEANTEYTVSVRAVNSLYTTEIFDENTLYSKPLTAKFTMPEATLRGKADIIDLEIHIDNNSRSVKNAANNGFEAVSTGIPTIYYDSSVERTVIKFNGLPTALIKFSDYSFVASNMRTSMTFEAYFKIDELPRKDSSFCVISSQEVGGFGLNAYHNGQICSFNFHDSGVYHSIDFTYELGRYYHLVAVYSNGVYTLYVDGVKIGSKRIGGAIYLPSVDAQTIYMGADTTETGGYSYLSKCTVADFKLYSYALTEEEVLNAYSSK